MKTELAKFPREFLERLSKFAPPGLLPEIHRGFCEPKPTTFRINTLKTNGLGLIRELEQLGLICEPVKNFPDAFLLKKGSLKKLRESRPYGEGWIYLQSLSSQIPPMVLDPKPGERVCDLCAAPGGKTCQMAAMMQNRGEIVAVEPHPIRYEKLVYNLKRQGVEIAEAMKMSGEKIVGATLCGCPKEGGHTGPPLHKEFDRIMLDAPCSSEGTFCVNDPKSFSHWSVESIKKMAARQKSLLRAAVDCLKPGGYLVYSTCALSREENEEVVRYILNERPEIKICDIPLKFPFLKPALPPVTKAHRIYPSPTMEGFFVCLMMKR